MRSLPEDALLLVISFLNVDTFLTARLLDRGTHDLIKQQTRGLVTSVAQATLPGGRGFLTWLPLSPNSGAFECLAWLKDLRYQYLAAVMLECRLIGAQRETSQMAVPAEDPVGDGARSHSVVGLRVLNQFSAIARAADVLPQEQLAHAAGDVDSQTDDLRSMAKNEYHRKEVHICQKRLEYVRTFDLEMLHAYRHLRHEKMVKLFFDFSPMPLIDRERGTVSYIHNHLVTAWLFSRIARAGPAWLWQLWHRVGTSSTTQLRRAADELHHEWDITCASSREDRVYGLICIDRLINFKLHAHMRPVRVAYRQQHGRDPPAEVILPGYAAEAAIETASFDTSPACVMRPRSLIIPLEWSKFGFALDHSQINDSDLLKKCLRYEEHVSTTQCLDRQRPLQLMDALSPDFEVLAYELYDALDFPQLPR
ncbi:hypothetical protein LTR95_002320 [Oleoguttula sp. CCFEE 5521]